MYNYINYIKKYILKYVDKEITPLGDFKDKGVGITGTDWRPKLPIECNYELELKTILDNPNKLDRCLDLFCWIQRSQMFIDGNKRVANLIANKEMIKNVEGILAIPVEEIGNYFTKLIKHYETNDNKELKDWLYDNALDGI